MEWFRMYSEFANDPKVQSMSEAMQRRLMMLLCLRCSNTLVTLQDDEIAFALRISDAELTETKALFVRKGFINEAWEIQNWDKRQFVSDSSASRVARHRAKAKEQAETQVETPCNVTVTPQIQNRTDTDTEQKKEQKTPHTPQAGLARKSSSAISLKAYLEQCKAASAKPIPEDDSVFDYAAKVGISTDFLRLQWLEFKDRYGMDGAKRYKAWPSVFGKSVRGNWFKLWYASNDGSYTLTTVGQQAKRQHGEAA